MSIVVVRTKRKESPHVLGHQWVQAELCYAVFRVTEYPQVGARRIFDFEWNYEPKPGKRGFLHPASGVGVVDDSSWIRSWFEREFDHPNLHSGEVSL